MGNLQFLTARHGGPLTDKKVTDALNAISHDRFRDQLVIGRSTCWTIAVPGEAEIDEDHRWQFSWELYRRSQRKLYCKHAHGQWSRWVQAVVLYELAFRLFLNMSDEGISDPPWKITPAQLDKIATYRRYFNLLRSDSDWIVERTAEQRSELERSWRDHWLNEVPADWQEEASKP
jgi:hypothetical protein